MRRAQVTAYEQYMLELTNQLRIENGVQPLAGYAPLENSADDHSRELLATDVFQHEMDLRGLITDNGFQWRNAAWGIFENHQWSWGHPGDLQDQVDIHHQGFLNSPAHLENTLNPEHEMAGISVMTGNFQGLDGAVVTTQHFAWNGRDAFVLGVAFDDRDGDQFYDPGEGLSKVNVRIVDEEGNLFRTTTDANGAYELELGPGEYDITFLKGKATLGTDSVVLAELNQKVDLII